MATVNSLGRGRHSDTGGLQRHQGGQPGPAGTTPSTQQPPLETGTSARTAGRTRCQFNRWKEPHSPAQQPLTSGPCPFSHKAQTHLEQANPFQRILSSYPAPQNLCKHSFLAHTGVSLSEQQPSEGVSVISVVLWAGSLTQKESFVPFGGPGCPKSRSVPCTSRPGCPRRTSRSQPRTGCHLQEGDMASGPQQGPHSQPGGSALPLLPLHSSRSTGTARLCHRNTAGKGGS